MASSLLSSPVLILKPEKRQVYFIRERISGKTIFGGRVREAECSA